MNWHDFRDIPQEVTDAALIVGTYVAKEGWQGDWALMGLCSRGYREKEVDELKASNDRLKGMVRKLIDAL